MYIGLTRSMKRRDSTTSTSKSVSPFAMITSGRMYIARVSRSRVLVAENPCAGWGFSFDLTNSQTSETVSGEIFSSWAILPNLCSPSSTRYVSMISRACGCLTPSTSRYVELDQQALVQVAGADPDRLLALELRQHRA